MAPDYEAFFSPLPKEIAETVEREGPSLTFETFTKWLNPASTTGRREHSEIGNYVMNLSKPGRKKHACPSQHVRKKLSLGARRKLGLNQLGRHQLTYLQLLPVHNLWKSYMHQVLDLEQLQTSEWNNSPLHSQFDLISLKLYRADYHGAFLTVIKSSCPSLVGCSGLVAMETKNCYKLVGEDDRCRTIPKNTCQFSFTLDQFYFSFYGKNLIVRPAERSSKKIKVIKPPSL